MNHHDENQMLDTEIIQTSSSSIPSISSLISNIQSLPLSSDYSMNQINPTVIDFSLLNHTDESSLNELEINQANSTSIPSISSLINNIQPLPLSNQYHMGMNQSQTLPADYSSFPVDETISEFSCHRKIERKNPPIMSASKNKSFIKANLNHMDCPKMSQNKTNDEHNAAKKSRSVSLQGSDFNSEKYESLANLNSTLDLLVAVSCQINERNNYIKEHKEHEQSLVSGAHISNTHHNMITPNGKVKSADKKVKMQRAKSLPQSAIDIMIEYFDSHSDHPYPSTEDRRKMSIEGKLLSK